MNPPSVRPFFVEIAQEDGREKKNLAVACFRKFYFSKHRRKFSLWLDLLSSTCLIS